MNSAEQLLLADIRELFSEFKCTIQDLRNPTEEFVTNFYSYFLQEFEVDINNITLVQFSQSQIVNAYQDAYSGIIPKLNLLKCIRSLEIVPDFGMLDITSPTPKRTQNILNAFITFYMTADASIAQMREKKEKLNERKARLKRFMEQKEELRENLNSITKNIATIQDDKTKLEEESRILQEKSSELRIEKQSLKVQIGESSNKLKEKETVTQKLDKEEAQISNKIKEYSSMIVDSPTSIISDLESLRIKQQEVIELSDQKRDMVETKMQSQSKLLKSMEDQKSRGQQLEDILKLIDQHRELHKAVSSTEKNAATCLEQLSELKSLLLSLRNKKQNRQEQLQSLLLKWKTLKPKLTESVESAMRELNEKKNEKHKMSNQLEEDDAVQESIDSLMEKIKIFVENLQESYNKLKQQEKEHYDQLDLSLKLNMETEQEEAEKKYKGHSK